MVLTMILLAASITQPIRERGHSRES